MIRRMLGGFSGDGVVGGGDGRSGVASPAGSPPSDSTCSCCCCNCAFIAVGKAAIIIKIAANGRANEYPNVSRLTNAYK